MASHTPTSKRFNQYSFDVANSPFGKQALSPDSTFEEPTSSLLYINSQLIAHGFAKHPLDISDLEPRHQERIVRCLFAMLHQRVDDLTHLERLSTSHRTLSYEFERLTKMHKVIQEEKDAALRKEIAAKAQLVMTQTALKKEQEALRKVKEDAQKARTALTFVRSQAQHDIKKRETETARTLDRWQKLSNEQAKQTSTRSGLTCVNASVSGPGSFSSPRVPEPSRLSLVALQEVEEARLRLVEENDAFRRILWRLANGLQTTVFSLIGPDGDVSNRLMPNNLFESTSSTPSTSILSHATTAQSKILNLLEALTVQIKRLEDSAKVEEETTNETVAAMRRDLEGAQAKIAALQDELDQTTSVALKVASAQPASANISDISDTDEIASSLAQQKEALDAERQKFTEAAVKLGLERAEIEAERLAFLEEKRALTVDAMLSTLPPTPQASTSTPLRRSPRNKGKASVSSRESLARTVVIRSSSRKGKEKASVAFLSEWDNVDEDAVTAAAAVDSDAGEASGSKTGTSGEKLKSAMATPRRLRSSFGGGGGLPVPGSARKVRFPSPKPRAGALSRGG